MWDRGGHGREGPRLGASGWGGSRKENETEQFKALFIINTLCVLSQQIGDNKLEMLMPLVKREKNKYSAI